MPKTDLKHAFLLTEMEKMWRDEYISTTVSNKMQA
jgi:hypothetical protein